MNFDEFCKGSFRKWDGDPPEGVKTWDSKRARFVNPFTMKSEARKFTTTDGTCDCEHIIEQMDAYVGFMNNGRLRGDISSGYTYEVKTNNPYPNSIQKALYDYIANDINQIIKKGENTMPTNYNEFFAFTHSRGNVYLPKIKDVIFNPPATIVLWDDKSKTVVKAYNEDYDPEKGLAMCILKKVYGNKGKYFNNIKKWTDKYQAKKEAEEEAKYREILREEEDEAGDVLNGKVIVDATGKDVFELCVVKSERKAEKVLSRMRELVKEQGYVTVSQYYELCGRKYTAWGTKIGWNKLRGVKIYKVIDGYKIWLPKPNWTKE